MNTVIEAYNKHYHLTIRPDDVWISIISQFCFYINANAKELRSKFVKHEGKNDLMVILPPGFLHDIDFELMASKMTELLHENLVDEDLRKWILPAFSTTTKTDTTISAIVMMASMKSYSNFFCLTKCGIPSVTLDGTKEDWEEIKNRLNKLDEFGEPTQLWAQMLRPVISKFIATFDGEVGGDFWGHVASPINMGSGSPTIGGWITAFCAFDGKGGFIGPASPDSHPKGWNIDYETQKYSLDGVYYPIIDQRDIPVGSVEVNLTVIEFGVKEYETIMIAGNMGMKVTPGQESDGDMVQNAPMWCVCLKSQKQDSVHYRRGRRPVFSKKV